MCGALSSGDMGMIKMMKAGEEECVQQRDKMKNSCGNERLQETKERNDSLVKMLSLEMCTCDGLTDVCFSQRFNSQFPTLIHQQHFHSSPFAPR